ncbi:hypothetical protein [Mucilaginibacter dorajii]|nr:hypothetical protein [Mucilaginibacter dorajii]MCS3737571.1 putative DNA-binding ArsR family transcriptional regulator [Mucilaginibacter dorajii]
MKRIFLFSYLLMISLLLMSGAARSQSIFTALHLNEEREYKTAKPRKIIETNTFYNSKGKEVKKAVKTFDSAGMLLTEERFDEDNQLTSRSTYTNDTVNRLVLENSYEDWTKITGTTKETIEYIYDSNNFLVRVLDKNKLGNVYEKFEIINNEHGDPIDLAGYRFNNALFGRESATYLYNQNKAIVSVSKADGTVLSTDTMLIKFKKALQFPTPDMAFNEQGDMINWTTKNFNGTQTFYTAKFDYDNKGNCTNETIYKVTIKPNGKQKQEINRNFKKEYFY